MNDSKHIRELNDNGMVSIIIEREKETIQVEIDIGLVAVLKRSSNPN
jgi:hypothetical protein